ncbi:MAG: hypothetical protein QOD42_1827 [Sphingomonadales bacterium]|jgi:hypothetical protein|nr:hypothetical protein [Sphingomonadales bacterium]
MFRGVGRNALDLPVAGLAAAAAVFFAFAMPQDVLSQIVSATGLPSLFAAAQPPLGLTARIAIALGGALVTFGLVFFLLRLLDRSGLESGRARPAAAEPEDGEAPRRRRDYHPDAPVRRPISAARDLGEPAPPAPPRAAVPTWLDEAEPAAAPEPEAVIEPEPAPAAEMPTSIAALMERLEQGLARRQPRRGTPAIPPSPQALAPQVFPEAPDDRLQSAIDSLQRLAARQS